MKTILDFDFLSKLLCSFFNDFVQTIILAVWQKLKCRLEISTDTPLVSLFDSRTQQPISFLIKHFRSSWGFCLAARIITCSKGKSLATTYACDSRSWQFLVTAISNIKKYLVMQWKFEFFTRISRNKVPHTKWNSFILWKNNYPS